MGMYKVQGIEDSFTCIKNLHSETLIKIILMFLVLETIIFFYNELCCKYPNEDCQGYIWKKTQDTSSSGQWVQEVEAIGG